MSRDVTASVVVRAALLAAFLGGFGAVAAEVVFTRRMAMMFGVTAPAVATVVAVYLAGMALGSVVGGRVADRLGDRAPLLYLAAESMALVWAVIFLPLASLFDTVSLQVPLSWSVGAAAVGTVLLVGPAALASGATFPALSRVVGRATDVRWLVACNTLGAAFGSLAAGFWLPHLIGYSGSLWLGGALAVVAGLIMWVATRGRATATPEAHPEAADPVSPRSASATYAVLGATAMVAELGWTRLLEQTGPNPGALTFPLVLAAYLFGYGAGGAWLEPRLRRLGERRGLAVCLALSGAACVAGVAALPFIPAEQLVGHGVGWGPYNTSVFAWTGLQVSYDRVLVYLLATVVPGLASGAGFPIVATALMRSGDELGTGVGNSWAAGTAAAVVASLWMGFMPGVGPSTVHMVAGMGLGSLAAGVWMLGDWRFIVVPALALPALAVAPSAGLQIPDGERLLHFKETAAGPSAVTVPTAPGSRQDVRNVYTHGERVSGFALDLEVPLLLHPDPKRVLLIAFGTGINVRGMLNDPAVEELVCVDIDPALPELAHHIPAVGPVFDDPRASFVHADGRHFLRLTEPRWDIIYDDVATYAQYVELGTVEFFELARDTLAPGGLFVVKLHSDTITPDGQARFLATFRTVFPDALLFDAHGALPILVASADRPLDYAAFVERAARTASVYGADARTTIERMNILDAAALGTLASGPVNTDDRPMALRHMLIGPYISPDTYTASGQTPFFDAADRLGRAAVNGAFGQTPEVQPLPSLRADSPPVPAPRSVAWDVSAPPILGWLR